MSYRGDRAARGWGLEPLWEEGINPISEPVLICRALLPGGRLGSAGGIQEQISTIRDSFSASLCLQGLS